MKPELRSVVLGSDVVSAAAHRGVLRLRVRARDDVAVWAVHAFVWSLGLRNSREGNLRRISGTVRNGVWAGRIVVPRTVGDTRRRTWSWRSATTGDGGARTVPAHCARWALPHNVRVVGHVDDQRPQVRQPRIRPVGVDLRTGSQKRFVVRVRITDVGAGVSGRPSFTFEGSATNMDHQGYDLDMRLVSGTRRDGIWQTTFTLPRCEAEAGHWSGYVTASTTASPVTRPPPTTSKCSTMTSHRRSPSRSAGSAPRARCRFGSTRTSSGSPRTTCWCSRVPRRG